MINHIKFNLNMIKIFEEKYPQIPLDILVDIIDVVLNRAPDMYFNFEQVQNHPEFCIKCGDCCQKISCEYFNGKTCDNYISRFDACKEYPFFELNNDSGLMLVCECNFANKLAEIVLDIEFQKNLDLFSLD